jgi:hypothetical protein
MITGRRDTQRILLGRAERKDLDMGITMILKVDLDSYDDLVWIGFIWFKMVISEEPL